MSGVLDHPTLREALARAPDPERAARLAERALEAAAPLLPLDAAGLARALHACCGVAPFLAPWLANHPDWLAALARDDLGAPLAREALDAGLAAALADAPDAEAARLLREAKYRALARIVTRDCDAQLVPLARSGETLAELTTLAEALLDAALRVAQARVAARHGPAPGCFCVLGLGKLGGEELNFSSDVDLVYVFDADGAGGGSGELAPPDYWTRVTRELSALVATETQQRFLYRIDLDLRPEGELGPPVVSEPALLAYYENAADHWEKVAFMKARPVAGDLDLGWRAVRAVAPMIYQATMDYASVQRIRSLKDEIGRQRGARGQGFDVKLDPGGIRDVEFVAQAMQLLHGGRIPQLRDRSTQRALRRLAEVRLLPADEAEALLDAYLFLRRVENRLQMEEEQQVHRLPQRPEALRRLVRAMGHPEDDGPARFAAELEARRERVLGFAARFRAESEAEEVVQLFLRHQPALAGAPATRAMMDSLAHAFAREIAASADPALAMNNLDRFIEGIGARRFYYELLLDRPELVRRLATLFASSRWLSHTLARHPRLIEPLFADPDVLLLDRAHLREDLAALRRERAAAAGRADYESELEALRFFVHRQVMNVALLDVDERVPRADCERALTEVAEVTLEAALEIARREVERVRPPGPGAAAARFLVVGMGKLASRELSYGSDLDLIFLYDLPPEHESDRLAAQEHCVRVAQRLISALETPTAEGACYEIDSRLRPSGNQGTLVTSLAGMAAYYAGEAQLWERQALLRARPVAGDAAAAERFEALRREALARPLPPDAAAEIHRIRVRMEAELADESRGHRDLKRGRGGLLDVETVVQLLQLRHGAAAPELHDVERTETMLERLTARGLLPPAQAGTLAQGWAFLQRLAARLRIVENRSISELDAGSSQLDAVARRLGYAAGAREASARSALLRDYASHTEAVRAAYLAILGVTPAR